MDNHSSDHKIDLTYPAVLDLFVEHRDKKRTDSAAFLIWYLENYYRLDSQEAIDSICDQPGDKGIDGIYVNENEGVIYVLQSKLLQKPNAILGDNALREFAGTLSQFSDKMTLQNLVSSAGEAQVAKLVQRLELLNKIGI